MAEEIRPGGSHHRRHRPRRHRPPAEPYMVCLSASAVACLLTVIAMLIWRPDWDTPLLGVPLGAFLLGGFGGLAALAMFPGWARRVDLRPAGMVALSWYRVLGSALIGGTAFGLASLAVGGSEDPGGVLYGLAAVAGLVEKPIGDRVLGWLGVLAPAEETARLRSR